MKSQVPCDNESIQFKLSFIQTLNSCIKPQDLAFLKNILGLILGEV